MNFEPSRAHLRRIATPSREVARQLDPLRADPAHTAVLLDIDGTLAPLVVHPGRAHIPAVTRWTLRRVEASCGLLGVVTGRRATNARQIVGMDIVYAGNHGLEFLMPGATAPVPNPLAAPWRAAIRDVVDNHCGTTLTAQGVRVEDKDVIVTLHWRGARNPAAARAAALAVADAAAEAGLRIQHGKDIVEIRPPIAIDKGTAVAAIVAANPQIRHVIYAGDDVTDVDAMRALGELRAAGRLQSVVRVGVWSEQVPAAVIANADVVVSGTRGVRGVLRRLERGLATR